MIKKLIGIVFILFLIFYWLFFIKANVENVYSIKITEETPFDLVYDSLERNKVIKNRYIFDMVHLMYSIRSVPAGHYKFKKSLNSLDILRKLKYGQQDPIRFTLSTATYVEDIASRVGEKMSFDSASFMITLMDENLMAEFNYDKHTALSKFIPNTYEFYWTSSPESFLKKWFKEHDKFWNQERRDKASEMNLDISQIYTMASMVQKEYYRKDERSKIAGVLINRLQINMPLQVDATCKYATRDFAAKRVLNYHTNYPSPFNTYKNMGLPPGPICVPEIGTIDAILDYEEHDYLFYCADPSLNGYHIFSKTNSEHETIARDYHRKMNELNIKK